MEGKEEMSIARTKKKLAREKDEMTKKKIIDNLPPIYDYYPLKRKSKAVTNKQHKKLSLNDSPNYSFKRTE